MNEKQTRLILAAAFAGVVLLASGVCAGDTSASGQLTATEQLSQQAAGSSSSEGSKETGAQAFDGQSAGGSAGTPHTQIEQEPRAVPGSRRTSGRTHTPASPGKAKNVTPYQKWIDRAMALMWAVVALLALAWVIGKAFKGANPVSKGLAIGAGILSLFIAYIGILLMMYGQNLQGMIFAVIGMILTAISATAAFGAGPPSGMAVAGAAAMPLAAQAAQSLSKKKKG